MIITILLLIPKFTNLLINIHNSVIFSLQSPDIFDLLGRYELRLGP